MLFLGQGHFGQTHWFCLGICFSYAGLKNREMKEIFFDFSWEIFLHLLFHYILHQCHILPSFLNVDYVFKFEYWNWNLLLGFSYLNFNIFWIPFVNFFKTFMLMKWSIYGLTKNKLFHGIKEEVIGLMMLYYSEKVNRFQFMFIITYRCFYRYIFFQRTSQFKVGDATAERTQGEDSRVKTRLTWDARMMCHLTWI